MQAAVGNRPPSAFDLVPGVEQVRIDAASGKLAGPQSPDAPFLSFLAGTAPSESTAQDGTSPPQNFFMEQ